MIVTKLATTFAVVTTLTTSALGQAVANTGLQQPTAFTPGTPAAVTTGARNPVFTAPAVNTVATSGVRQPDSQVVAAAPVTPVAGLHQPEQFSVPSSYASYYDDEDDSVADDSDYSDDVCCDSYAESFCDCGGWIQQGITFNGYDPADGFNGPVVLNDRANEYQMNQLWLYMAREVDNGGCGWDHGGRVDVVFGTDARFMTSLDGLEENWDQNEYYQLAILQFYYEVAHDDWNLKAGRMISPVGYEPWEATDTFFYSRSYNFLAQPNTITGLYLTRDVTDQFSLSAGLHRGSDQFDDRDGRDDIDFVGGGSWWSCDEETWLDVYVISEEQGIGNDTLHYSVVGGTPLSERWDYVVEWYYGHSDDAIAQAEWYGINQHFMREINDCWSYGFRFEWFRDDDGFIIFGPDPRNSAQGPFVGDFYELTFAVNYTPTENFALRPEIRWDWYKSDAGGPEPFNDGTRSNQFIASIDAIWAF